jgi:hypothetical protein
MMSRHRSTYQAGLASCLRIVYAQLDAEPEKKILVFRNQAAEIAGYIAADGVGEIEACDSLANAAKSIGLDPDTAQALMSDAINAAANKPAAAVTLSASIEQRLDGGGRTLVISNLAGVVSEKIEWLWPGRIAVGKLTLIAGEPGLGKSQVAIAIASAVTTGGKWPDCDSRAPIGSVVILRTASPTRCGPASMQPAVTCRALASSGQSKQQATAKRCEAHSISRPIWLCLKPRLSSAVTFAWSSVIRSAPTSARPTRTKTLTFGRCWSR